ncbi:unnamed protein product [Polarella glacialis]|uniref:Uncharacterized protein n=2 Tax=Polarella glacialis TaxID=89957 RepID=A0A813LH15_POLGL|nr:unnamed protein product [Polarella glacialis]
MPLPWGDGGTHVRDVWTGKEWRSSESKLKLGSLPADGGYALLELSPGAGFFLTARAVAEADKKEEAPAEEKKEEKPIEEKKEEKHIEEKTEEKPVEEKPIEEKPVEEKKEEKPIVEKTEEKPVEEKKEEKPIVEKTEEKPVEEKKEEKLIEEKTDEKPVEEMTEDWSEGVASRQEQLGRMSWKSDSALPWKVLAAGQFVVIFILAGVFSRCRGMACFTACRQVVAHRCRAGISRKADQP